MGCTVNWLSVAVRAPDGLFRLSGMSCSTSSTAIYTKAVINRRASDNHTGGPGSYVLGSVFRQQLEPLSFGQVTWRNDLEVPAVKGGYLMQVQPFGERYHASIHDLEPQR